MPLLTPETQGGSNIYIVVARHRQGSEPTKAGGFPAEAHRLFFCAPARYRADIVFCAMRRLHFRPRNLWGGCARISSGYPFLAFWGNISMRKKAASFFSRWNFSAAAPSKRKRQAAGKSERLPVGRNLL